MFLAGVPCRLINNKSVLLVQVMSWRQTGDSALPAAMLTKMSDVMWGSLDHNEKVNLLIVKISECYFGKPGSYI